MGAANQLGANTLVFYHVGCQDGLSAAWVIKRFAWENGLPMPSFRPMNWKEDITRDVLGCGWDKVIFVDIAPEIPYLETILGAVDVDIYDHHQRVAIDYLGFEHPRFKLFFSKKEHSGCTLVWLNFFGLPLPDFLKYVRAGDLWLDVPGIKEHKAALASYHYTFSKWDMLFTRSRELVLEGESIVRSQEKDIERSARTAYPICLDGIDMIAVCSQLYISELGNYLVRKEPGAVALIWYPNVRRQLLVCGLRSFKETPDVDKIAAKFGGGGHAAASGFNIPLNSHEAKIIMGMENK